MCDGCYQPSLSFLYCAPTSVSEIKINYNSTSADLFYFQVFYNDIIFPLVDVNLLLDCDAAWVQVMLHSAKHIANQQPYSALSDHMISSKI